MRRQTGFIVFVILILSSTGCNFSQPLRLTGVSDAAWQDDFSPPSAGWKIESDSRISRQVSDGRLTLAINEPQTHGWSKAHRYYSDVTLEADAAQLKGPANSLYGLIFRVQNDRNFYELDISADGYISLWKWVDGQPTPLIPWMAAGEIKQGFEQNHLKIEARGSSITVWINGVKALHAQDSSYAAGDVGVIAGTYEEGGLLVAFDNFSAK